MTPLARVGNQALVPAARGAPGFTDGVGALFSGFGMVVASPSIWPLAMVPVAIATSITAGLGYAAVHFLPGLVDAWLHGGILAAVVKVGAVILGLVVAVLGGMGLAQPLAGPALNAIVRRAEAIEGAPAWPATSTLEDVMRGLHSIAIAYSIGLPILALLFLLSFTPAAPVAYALKVMVLAVMIAWDLCDYPLSLRGLPIRTRIAFMRRHAGAMIGFGFGLALLSLVPCALLLVLPAGVAGAARLVARIERWETARASAAN